MTSSLSAQKTDAAARSAEIAELSRAGKYSEAIPLAQRLLADMERPTVLFIATSRRR